MFPRTLARLPPIRFGSASAGVAKMWSCNTRVVEALGRPRPPVSDCSRTQGQVWTTSLPSHPRLGGCRSSTHSTVSGLGSMPGKSRLTTTGSWPLRTRTQDKGASSLALISWCGTKGGT